MKKILFIEPDKVIARSIEQYFKQYFDLTITGSAKEAIFLADESTPDIVIMEIQLKNFNGIDFIHEFRSYTDWQNIPIIIYSIVPPSEFPQNKNFWKKMNIQHYLYKPNVKLKTLNVKIDELITANVS